MFHHGQGCGHVSAVEQDEDDVPSVRGERVVRALERAGFKVARVAGSRHIMRHPDGRGTTVPVRHGRDVAKGTPHGILSDVGMTIEELQRLL